MFNQKSEPYSNLLPWFASISLMTCSVTVSGNAKVSDGLRTYLLSRDYSNLKSEFQNGNGKVGPHILHNLCFIFLFPHFDECFEDSDFLPDFWCLK